MKITVKLSEAQAAALLKFLRLHSPLGVKDLLDPSEVEQFSQASEQVRMALRDVVEPGWRDDVMRQFSEPRK
jgi:hypothetical protein